MAIQVTHGSFRGVLLDVARRYHSVSTLRTIVCWCGASKVHTLILHLTDDQNWMLPTTVLAGVDANNTHGKPAYSRREIIDLEEFAAKHGVALVPELDLPGHSSLLIKFDSTLFQIKGSESDGCINFGSPLVRKKVKALLNEVILLFPRAPYIHLGGDEAWYPNAEKDTQMAAFMKTLGPGKTPGDVFVDFVAEMAQQVLDDGKIPIVWEGFPPSDFAKKRIPKRTLIAEWDGGFYPAKQLIPDGFKVINAGWDPYYVVNHYPYDVDTLVPLERLLHSSPMKFGTVDTGSHPDVAATLQDPNAVGGSLLCWWEGQEWNAQTTLPPRIFAFGASLSDGVAPNDYLGFMKTYKKVSAGIAKATRPFVADVTGTLPENDREFESTATVRLVSSNKALRYAVRHDGLPPTVADGIDGSTFTVKQSEVVAIQAFTGDSAEGETLFLPFKKVTVVRSLTTGCPISFEGDRDPQFSASNLVDGVSDDPTAYWLAYPCPQSVTIDLRAVKPVNRIQVVCLWTNAAPTSYRVEGSIDKKLWKQLVDRSANKKLHQPTKDTLTRSRRYPSAISASPLWEATSIQAPCRGFWRSARLDRNNSLRDENKPVIRCVCDPWFEDGQGKNDSERRTRVSD